MKPLVKICGITTTADAQLACDAGADYLGVIVDIDESPRSVSAATAGAIRRCTHCPVILLTEKPVGAALELLIDVAPFGVQLIGRYTPENIATLKSHTSCAIWTTVPVPQSTVPGEVDKLAGTLNGLAAAGVETIVLDTLVRGHKGGTGQTCDWDSAAQLVSMAPVAVLLAGGITPDNAAAAIRKVQPRGIDLSSGVEQSPGKKDPLKLTRLMHAVSETTTATHPLPH